MVPGSSHGTKAFLEPLPMDPSGNAFSCLGRRCHHGFDPSLWQKDMVAGRTPYSTTQRLLQSQPAVGRRIILYSPLPAVLESMPGIFSL